MALRNTLVVTLSHSGFRRNSRPAPEPGNAMEQPASMINRINNIGIIILADFSIPFSTPFTMMKWVTRRKSTSQITGRQGLEEKELNVLI